MNTENDPPQQTPDDGNRPESHSGDAAARAMEQAKQKLSKGMDDFKKLDRMGQIYLGGLAVVVVFGLIFDIVSIKTPEIYKQFVGHMGSGSTLAGAGNGGLLAFLAAIAGIAIFIWNLKTPGHRAWVPNALAGCAAAIPILMFIATRGIGSEFGGVKISRSLLGFWVPFLGAAAATWASVKPILDARPNKPSAPTSSPPPPPPPPPVA